MRENEGQPNISRDHKRPHKHLLRGGGVALWQVSAWIWVGVRS